MAPNFVPLLLASMLVSNCSTSAFVSNGHPSKSQLSRPTFLSARRPSKVQDPAGPTPVLEPEPMEMIDPDDIPELKDISDPAELPHPIEHQPWRRGETNGCEAPITVDWRQKAEDIIYKSVSLVGGRALDITWYLTSVVVTLDEDVMPPRDFIKSAGPEIDIVEPTDPIYYDPTDPEPEEIWDDEEDVLFVRETEEEAIESAGRKEKMYATKREEDPADEPHIPDRAGPGDDVPLYMNEETRQDIALKVTEEEQERYEEMEKPINLDTIAIDTAALSTIAKAILDALQEEEDELRILQRHELVLAAPGPEDVIETQKQFDAYRDSHVIVQTQDPFESNRILKGKLVDRNAMDLILNIKGRMVTVPLNFVRCVRLAPTTQYEEEEEEEEDEEPEEE